MASSRSSRSFRLLYTKRAVGDIEKLDAITRKRLGKKLQQYVESGDPLSYARRLVSPDIGTYRFRVGDYRIVFDVSGQDLLVLRVGHRRDIYRR